MGGAPASLHTLVADDEPLVGRAMQRVLRRMLRRRGHRVSLAHDGAAALDIDLRDPADLLITHMNMPRLDGIGTRLAFSASKTSQALRSLIYGGVAIPGVGDFSKPIPRLPGYFSVLPSFAWITVACFALRGSRQA
ncbi:MAG TPA: response regulator [Azospirillum sp.]